MRKDGGRSVQTEWDRLSQGPEAEKNTNYLKTRKKASIVRAQSNRRVVQGEAGEVSRVRLCRDL